MDELEQLTRETLDKIFSKMTSEEFRKRFSPARRLEGLSAEEVVRAHPPETLAALARQLHANGSSPKSP